MKDLPPMIGTNIRPSAQPTPIFKNEIKVTGQVAADGNIEVITDRFGEIIQSFIVRAQDQAVRECLIKLGWTPPKDEGRPL